MTTAKPIAFCMLATPFAPDGSIDEAGLRAHLRRMVAAGCGVYLGSPGTGEGHGLTLSELGRLYEIGVEECKGRVPTNANPPEQRTSAGMIAGCSIAAKAGVEVIEVYHIDGGHGMRPTEAELERYYRDVFDAIDHPVSLSVHPTTGYLPPVRLFQKLCSDYRQIVAANLVSVSPTYLIEMKEALGPRIPIYAIFRDALEALALGVQGYQVAEANLAPYLARVVGEKFASGEMEKSAAAYAHLAKMAKLLQRYGRNPPAYKAAMKILGLPGGTGVVRKPYLALAHAESEKLARELQELGLPQLEEAACTSLRA